MKTLQQIVLDFDKCDIQVLLAAMTSVWGRRDGHIRGRESRDGGWGAVIKDGKRMGVMENDGDRLELPGVMCVWKFMTLVVL